MKEYQARARARKMINRGQTTSVVLYTHEYGYDVAILATWLADVVVLRGVKFVQVIV